MTKKLLSGMLVVTLLAAGTAVATADTSMHGSTTMQTHSIMVGDYKHTFSANLSGGMEVPPVTTQGMGTSEFHVSGDERTIHYKLGVHNLSSPVTGAHLHCAPMGQNGPVVVPLANPMGSTTHMMSEGMITESQITAASAACSPNIRTASHLVQAMREGQMYVNVHTELHPSGEVRGQLMLQDGKASPVYSHDDHMKMYKDGYSMMKEGYSWMSNPDKMYEGYMMMHKGYMHMHDSYKHVDADHHAMMTEAHTWMLSAHQKMLDHYNAMHNSLMMHSPMMHATSTATTTSM
ncbi:MAG: CHRD domain-containing protein [Patescibacteria group bacterium]